MQEHCGGIHPSQRTVPVDACGCLCACVLVCVLVCVCLSVRLSVCVCVCARRPSDLTRPTQYLHDRLTIKPTTQPAHLNVPHCHTVLCCTALHCTTQQEE